MCNGVHADKLKHSVGVDWKRWKAEEKPEVDNGYYKSEGGRRGDEGLVKDLDDDEDDDVRPSKLSISR